MLTVSGRQQVLLAVVLCLIVAMCFCCAADPISNLSLHSDLVCTYSVHTDLLCRSLRKIRPQGRILGVF